MRMASDKVFLLQANDVTTGDTLAHGGGVTALALEESVKRLWQLIEIVCWACRHCLP
jgi:hypothetical protein